MIDWMNEWKKILGDITWMREMKWINEWINMSEFKWMIWNEWIKMKQAKLRNWHEWIKMNELKWRNWNEGIEMKELKWMNEWIDMSELKWMNWHLWIEMKDLNWMNWMNELKWMNWNEVIDINKLTRVNSIEWMIWNEGIEMNELKWLHSHEWIEINDSLAHLFPTSSSKSAPNVTQITLFKWNRALTTVRYSPVHFLSTTFPDRAAHPRKQRPSFGDHGSHFTRRNTGFRARECFQTWIHAFPTSYASQLLDNYLMM